MGRMTSTLKPVADRYNKLSSDERYQFRRQSRSFVKWYGYVAQVARMFDKELHEEYVFLSYLLGLLPAEPEQMIDLEGKLQLEYYKLQKTFEGSISLQKENGGIKPADGKSIATPEKKQPLDEIIEKINEQYKGAFTEADKVLLSALRTRLIQPFPGLRSRVYHHRRTGRDSAPDIQALPERPLKFYDREKARGDGAPGAIRREAVVC